MSKRYGSFDYVLGPLLYGKSVGAGKLLAGMTRWPFRPAALTCAGKTDGGGAQVHAVLSVLCFCEAFGYTYLHTPFQKMEHTQGPSEVAEWETLFNLGEGEIPADKFEYPIVPASQYAKSRRLWVQNVAVAVEALHGFTDNNPGAYLKIKNSVRKKYKGVKPGRDSNRLHAAIHIRRGDAAADAHRYTSNASLLTVIKAVRQACERIGRGCDFVIHSQGQPQDFKDFADEGCELCLNAPALTSLNALIHADVLMLAKSSFSYVAGLLNESIVVYDPFWHAPPPGWTGIGDMETLVARIANLAGSPAALTGGSHPVTLPTNLGNEGLEQ